MMLLIIIVVVVKSGVYLYKFLNYSLKSTLTYKLNVGCKKAVSICGYFGINE